MSDVEVSVVIGFRDWGTDRLAIAVERLSASTLGKDLDVVVSDYGSQDEEGVRRVVETAGGRVVRTPRSGPWSRSRALNAGVRGTNSPFVITTDADMIFARDTARRLRDMLALDSNTIQLVQCRDLVPAFDATTAGGADDKALECNSRFRPRWGMGGLIAFARADFDLIGGYDARMQIYGGEDIDFAQRFVRAGRRLNWLDDPEVRIFHIWHPSTRDAVQQDPEKAAAQENNRNIMLNDKSWLRNVNIGGRAQPVASVLIATWNRADYLLESVNSALASTVQDIEVVVLDDGSTDHTRDVLAEIDDPRVRHYSQEHAGVARARNRLVAEARASMIVVHDDDDIMLPWRVEVHLDAMTDELAATYGGWVNFDNGTGETVVFPGKAYSAAAFMYAGTVLSHGTSMFRAEILRRYPYREHLPSGVDFNMISRMANAGYLFRHTGHLHILRRMHDVNLTLTTPSQQKDAALRTTTLLRRRNSSEHEKILRQEARALAEVAVAYRDDLPRKILVYLPDHLARRQAMVAAPDAETARRLKALFPKCLEAETGWINKPNLLSIPGISHADLARLRRIPGLTYEVLPFDPKSPPRAGFEQLLASLPTSGLLDPEGINRVLIRRIEGPGEDPPSNPAVRWRHWFDGIAHHEVSAMTVPAMAVAMATSTGDTDEVVFVLPGADRNDA